MASGAQGSRGSSTDSGSPSTTSTTTGNSLAKYSIPKVSHSERSKGSGSSSTLNGSGGNLASFPSSGKHFSGSNAPQLLADHHSSHYRGSSAGQCYPNGPSARLSSSSSSSSTTSAYHPSHNSNLYSNINGQHTLTAQPPSLQPPPNPHELAYLKYQKQQQQQHQQYYVCVSLYFCAL